jgi:hypothetical protein
MSTPEQDRPSPEDVGGIGDDVGASTEAGPADTPQPTRGSGETGPEEDLAAGAATDPDLLAEGGRVPPADVRDVEDADARTSGASEALPDLTPPFDEDQT